MMLEIASSIYSSSLQEIIVGECYLNGIGTKFDRVKAEEWFQKTKKHGNDLACLRLSYLYASLEDNEQSMSCLRRAKWHGSKLSAAMLKRWKNTRSNIRKHSFTYKLIPFR